MYPQFGRHAAWHGVEKEIALLEKGEFHSYLPRKPDRQTKDISLSNVWSNADKGSQGQRKNYGRKK